MKSHKDREPWNPTRYKTECCEDIISSAWEGHFKQCSCGEAFVDQTKYYSRLGGRLKEHTEEPNDTNS